MTRLRLLCLAVVTLVAATILAAPTRAQSFPTQRVTIVVPFGAGSVTDILARIVADEAGRRWGQQVVVENRPGLAGTVGVSKAAPDGHTLMLTSNGHTVAALANKNLPFDPVKDFSGITRVASAPLYLIVHPEVPARNPKELIELAKAKPGTLNFSSPGLASTTFIAGALFRKAAGIDIVHVPFKSAPDAVTAVVRGDAQMYFAPVNLSKEMAEAGKVRAIAAVTPQRIPAMPDVPTFREAGLDYVYDSFRRSDGAGRSAARHRQQAQPRPCGDPAIRRGEGQARQAIRSRRDRHAGRFRQDHPGRDRQPDRGVQDLSPTEPWLAALPERG